MAHTDNMMTVKPMIVLQILMASKFSSLELQMRHLLLTRRG